MTTMTQIPFDISYQIEKFNEYYDFESLVKHFYLCSLWNCINKFDFEEAFSNTICKINDKLAEHGLLSFEDYKEIEENIWGDQNQELINFEAKTDYIYIDSEELYEVVLKYKYEKYKHTFEGMFDNLEEIIDKYNQRYCMKEYELIALFDSIIHAQHVTGDIFDDCDPEDIRCEVESEYKEYMLK